LYFITAWRACAAASEHPPPNIESKMAPLTPFDGLLLAPFLEIRLAAEEPMRHVSHFHKGRLGSFMSANKAEEII
jgi:hypothetical protein